MSKRKELLMNAAKIIYEEGIQKLTIDYLAQRSDITKGGVLYHFESKENLILQMNQMVLKEFESLLKYHIEHLTGQSVFTRAYAYATLHFFKNPDTALLPAVFISSLENKSSLELWKKTSAIWEDAFKNDSGNPNQNLKLRLICDGIWFSILYGVDDRLRPSIEKVVLNQCKKMKECL